MNKSRVYKLLFLKARAWRAISIAKSIEAFNRLERLYPADLKIKRELARMHFDEGHLAEASQRWLYLYIKSKSDDDLCYLISSNLYSRKFIFLFDDIKMHRHSDNEGLKAMVAKLIGKKFIDYTLLLKNRQGISIDISHRDDVVGGVMHSNSENDKTMVRTSTSRGRRAMDDAIYTSTECEVDKCMQPIVNGKKLNGHLKSGMHAQPGAESIGNSESPVYTICGASQENTDFYLSYSAALEYIKSGHITKALNILLGIYGQSSYFDLLEFLQDHEKMEILYLLAVASPVLVGYYERALLSIQKSKIKVFNLLLQKKDQAKIDECTEML